MMTFGRTGSRMIATFAIAAALAFHAGALTVEKVYRTSATACDVQLSYAAAAADRAVLVAWGSSDAGATFTAWPNFSYAEGGVGAGSTTCRVTLPPAALSAAYLRFFLVPVTSTILRTTLSSGASSTSKVNVLFRLSTRKRFSGGLGGSGAFSTCLRT